MIKNRYIYYITKNSLNFINELKLKGFIDEYKFIIKKTKINYIGNLEYIGIPFNLNDLGEIILEFQNKTKYELNKNFTKKIKKIKKFDYDLWRKTNNLKEININYNIKYNKFCDEKVGLSISQIIKKLKTYRGDKKIEKCLLKFSKKYIIYTKKKLGYSCCIDMPLYKKSYILFDENILLLEGLFHFLHEIGHLIYNNYKYIENEKLTVEEDERQAYLIQKDIIFKIFPEYKQKFLEYLYSIYKAACVHYEFEKYLYEFKGYKFETRAKKFGELLIKNGFYLQHKDEWIYNIDIWENPFYSACYIIAIENLI